MGLQYSMLLVHLSLDMRRHLIEREQQKMAFDTFRYQCHVEGLKKLF